jgi:hypothetical protein
VLVQRNSIAPGREFKLRLNICASGTGRRESINGRHGAVDWGEPMKRCTVVNALLAVLSLALVGCGGLAKVDDPTDDLESFAFGYMDMTEAPAPMSYFVMQQVSPKTGKPVLINYRILDGAFYSEHVRPGTYRFHELGAQACHRFMGCNPNQWGFAFKDRGEQFKVSKPGLHYIGSYRYIAATKNQFRIMKFDVKRAKKPTEREVLQTILLATEGTGWNAAVVKRIRQLGG